MVRIYWACERGKELHVVYTQIVPAVALPHLAQALLFAPPKAAADEPYWEVRPNYINSAPVRFHPPSPGPPLANKYREVPSRRHKRQLRRNIGIIPAV
jgi:hypothetical protein